MNTLNSLTTWIHDNFKVDYRIAVKLLADMVLEDGDRSLDILYDRITVLVAVESKALPPTMVLLFSDHPHAWVGEIESDVTPAEALRLMAQYAMEADVWSEVNKMLQLNSVIDSVIPA